MNTKKKTEQFRSLLIIAAELSAELNGTDTSEAATQIATEFDQWVAALSSAVKVWDRNGDEHVVTKGDLIRLCGGADQWVSHKNGDIVVVTGVDGDGDIEFVDRENSNPSWTYASESNGYNDTRSWEPYYGDEDDRSAG